MVTLEEYNALTLDRPKKFTPEQVGYQEAPVDSPLRCSNCSHYFRRNIDAHATCEIFRSPETDKDGVQWDWRCRFFNLDGETFPLLKEEKPEGKTIRDGWSNE